MEDGDEAGTDFTLNELAAPIIGFNFGGNISVINPAAEAVYEQFTFQTEDVNEENLKILKAADTRTEDKKKKEAEGGALKKSGHVFEMT
jgi:hypothetical protein